MIASSVDFNNLKGVRTADNINKIDTINNLQSISTSFGKRTGRWRQKEFSKPLKKMSLRR